MFLETDPEKAKVSKALIAREATKPCAACGSTQRGIADAFENLMWDFKVEGEGEQSRWESRHIPVATVVCANCGLFTQFSLAVLGLWSQEEDTSR